MSKSWSFASVWQLVIDSTPVALIVNSLDRGVCHTHGTIARGIVWLGGEDPAFWNTVSTCTRSMWKRWSTCTFWFQMMRFWGPSSGVRCPPSAGAPLPSPILPLLLPPRCLPPWFAYRKGLLPLSPFPIWLHYARQNWRAACWTRWILKLLYGIPRLQPFLARARVTTNSKCNQQLIWHCGAPCY